MKLAQLIAQEAATPLEAVMLLRHGNDSVAILERSGATIEEFTAIQPQNTKWDYLNPSKPKVSLVVVVVNDLVYGVFRVLGIEKSGLRLELASQRFLEFEAARPSKERNDLCHRFHLQRISSVTTGLPVRGWEGRTRTPVQRSTDSFFNDIHVAGIDGQLTSDLVERSFEKQVETSLRSSRQERLARLAGASAVPPRVAIMSLVYARNPDVVAEALAVARGICQSCSRPAPFKRRSDGSPYLEVHHRTPLSQGGKDTVANAIAICPNCHRAAHFGET